MTARCGGAWCRGSTLALGARGRRFESARPDTTGARGSSSMVERRPSKPVTRVRFPSPAQQGAAARRRPAPVAQRKSDRLLSGGSGVQIPPGAPSGLAGMERVRAPRRAPGARRSCSIQAGCAMMGRAGARRPPRGKPPCSRRGGQARYRRRTARGQPSTAAGAAMVRRRCVVAVAQLVRAPGCGPGGRGFESPQSPTTAARNAARSEPPVAMAPVMRERSGPHGGRAARARTTVGRSQAVRQGTLDPRSQVRILPPQQVEGH